jgi:hypothetical protein
MVVLSVSVIADHLSIQPKTHSYNSYQPLVRLLESESERDQKNDNGVESLEHLDEGNAQTDKIVVGQRISR